MKGYSSFWAKRRTGAIVFAVSNDKRSRLKGISFIETLVLTGILAFIVGIAVPSFMDIQDRSRINGFATEMAANIQYAKSEAAARNRGVRISFGVDAGGSCYLLHTGNTGDCSCASSGSASCTNTDNSVLKSAGLAAAHGMTLQSNVASMLFDPARGTVTPAGSINFTNSSGKTIRHVVNVTGRARSCSPGGSVTGYQIC